MWCSFLVLFTLTQAFALQIIENPDFVSADHWYPTAAYNDLRCARKNCSNITTGLEYEIGTPYTNILQDISFDQIGLANLKVWLRVFSIQNLTRSTNISCSNPFVFEVFIGHHGYEIVTHNTILDTTEISEYEFNFLINGSEIQVSSVIVK